MAVRDTLTKAVKAALVSFAIVGGAALVAPGMASAAPVSSNAVAAPNDFAPIQRPAPVRWWCDWVVSPDGTTMAFDCSVGAGTITVAILCSDGNVYSQQVTGPGRFQFYLTC